MNRAQRRALKHKKPVQEVTRPLPAFLDNWHIFKFADDLIYNMQHDSVPFVQGEPVFYDQDGVLTKMVPSMLGWVETWEYIEQKTGVIVGAAHWRRICNKLYYSTTITQQEAALLEKSTQAMKQLINQNRSLIKSFGKNMQLKILLEGANG